MGVILYHGAKEALTGEILPISPLHINTVSHKSDFGQGFYLTEDAEFAKIMAASCNAEKYPTPWLYRFQFNTKGLAGYQFTLDIDWLFFVAYNRRKLPVSEYPELKPMAARYQKILTSYDYIVGPTADDKSYTILNMFFSVSPVLGKTILTHTEALSCLAKVNPCIQYTLLTKDACRNLSVDIHKEITQNHVFQTDTHSFSNEEYRYFTSLGRERALSANTTAAEILKNMNLGDGESFTQLLRRVDANGKVAVEQNDNFQMECEI